MRLLIGSFLLGASLLLASCTTNPPPAAPPPAPVVAPPPAPVAPPPAPAAPAPSPAPSSVSGSTAGGELFAQACQGCHGLDTVTSQRHDLAGWRGVVQDMINSGASLNDVQADQVARYLAANYGPGAP